MLNYHLRFMFRNFLRHKNSLVINLVGLSSAFTCAILIFLWVNDEKHVDKFHKLDKQLYQVMENHQTPEGIYTQAYTPDMLGRSFAEEMGEVELATSVVPSNLFGSFSLSANEDHKMKSDGQFADKDFFRVFSYNLAEGDPTRVLIDKNAIVISKKLAENLFGTAENVVGKTIGWKIFNYENQSVVSGVFEGTPANSTATFDFVLSFNAWLDLCNFLGRKIHWGNHSPYTYLVLNKDVNPKQFNGKIANFLQLKQSGSNISLFAIPYSSQYLNGKFENGVQAGGRISYVRLFSLLAIFILLIAGINFMNLATARSSRRIKEIGIKKVVGSRRSALVSQFISEAVILALFSLIIAIVLILILLPLFNQITAKHLVLDFNMQFLFTILSMGLITALVSGLYPALYLSGFNISQIIKGKIVSSVSVLWARKGLVVFQFAISVILIISVLVVYRQIEFIQHKNLGYNKDNLIYFSKEGGIAQQEEAFLTEAKQIPGVVNISSIGSNLIGSLSSTYGVNWEGKDENASISFEVVPLNYQMIETLKMEMAEGRNFDSKLGSEKEKIIVNQAAINVMGFKNPIGQTINFWGKEKQIVGIVKNFNFKSLKEEISPLLFYIEPKKTMQIMARIEAGQEKQTIAALGKIYSQFNPGFSFDYKFLDAAYQAQYETEQRVSILSRFFAGLGILISCLGLFGLATFAAEQRIKEIGIRKINGARISEVLVMLNRDFVKWVAIAFVIATPIAYYAMHKWLESFAYKTELSWWIFALAGVLALGIALLTVSLQSWRAARRNPVEALRYE